MSFCPFCGKKIEDGKCPGCGYTAANNENYTAHNADFGMEKNDYEIPLWLKAVIILAMVFLSGGSIIGVIAGAVLSSSKDPKFKNYGKWLLKTALIVLIVKAVLAIIAFIFIMVVGVGGAIFMSSPEFAGIVACVA